MNGAKFWLPFLYLLICMVNFAGLDDKNILLFVTSPAGWIAESGVFARTVVHPAKILGSISGLSLAIWFLIGLGLDRVAGRFKARRS